MKEKIIIYTDGSCTPNPGAGGWAAVIKRNEDEHEVISGGVKYTTNNRMEIKAVIEVIKHFVLTSNTELLIHSDSSYVVNTITKGWIEGWARRGWKTKANSDVKNKDLWVQLYKAIRQSQCEITMVKVKGHDGDELNELVHDVALGEANKMNESFEAGVIDEKFI